MINEEKVKEFVRRLFANQAWTEDYKLGNNLVSFHTLTIIDESKKDTFEELLDKVENRLPWEKTMLRLSFYMLGFSEDTLEKQREKYLSVFKDMQDPLFTCYFELLSTFLDSVEELRKEAVSENFTEAAGRNSQ